MKPIIFSPIPTFTPFGSNFIPQTAGVTTIPDPFKNFKTPNSIQFSLLPTHFLSNISRFLFAPIPYTLTTALSNTPHLASYLASVGIAKEQDMAILAAQPIRLTPPTEDIPGLFIITSGTQTISSYATYDSITGGLAQLIKVSPNQLLTLSLIPQSTGPVSATYLDQTLTFTDTLPATTYLSTPAHAGRYILKTSSSPIPLLIDVIALQPIQPPQSKPWGPLNFIWKLFNR